MLVESPGILVFRMHGKSANAGNVRRLECALHRISQKRFTNALRLPTAIYRQTGEQHDGHRMPRQTFRQPFRRLFLRHLPHRERVKSGQPIACYADICLRCACLLVLPPEALQVSIQLLAAAIEISGRVIEAQLFNAAVRGHRFGAASKQPGSFNRRFKRGSGRGGASRAARNAFHCVALRPKRRRSASASSALARALSSTNSLSERRNAAAAVCKATLSSGLSRRSSLSLRVARNGIALRLSLP